MSTLAEGLVIFVLTGLTIFVLRRNACRGSALNMIFASLALVVTVPLAAKANEARKGNSVLIGKDEIIKGDTCATEYHPSSIHHPPAFLAKRALCIPLMALNYDVGMDQKFRVARRSMLSASSRLSADSVFSGGMVILPLTLLNTSCAIRRRKA